MAEGAKIDGRPPANLASIAGRCNVSPASLELLSAKVLYGFSSCNALNEGLSNSFLPSAA